jgi:hypothetical protein
MSNSILKPIAVAVILAVAPLSISSAQAAVKVGSYIGIWSAKTSYAAGDLITLNNKTFLSLVARNLNKNPDTNPASWQLLGGVGAMGLQGPIGAQGLQGFQGLKGDAGAAGINGSIGPKGDTGLQGLIGLTGLAGTVGPKGDSGLTGATGATGTNGADGVDGAVGPKGDTGFKGDTGLAGTNGTNGIDGAIGPKGDTGLPGPVGANGADGPKGDIGLQGPAGADSTVVGPVGPRGPAGIPTSGTDVGDMQYWDGTNWVMIPAPSHMPTRTATATLHYCNNGIPTWEPTCLPPDGIYQIGDNGPAGGIVFYITNGGLSGMEVAPVNTGSNSIIWGCYGIDITGAYGTAIGTGAANTAAIVSGCGLSNTAAKVADDYVFNGYTDWYLPSQDELNMLYLQRYVVAGFINNFTWSSTQVDINASWALYYDTSTNAYQGPAGKDSYRMVLPIRTF